MINENQTPAQINVQLAEKTAKLTLLSPGAVQSQCKYIVYKAQNRDEMGGVVYYFAWGNDHKKMCPDGHEAVSAGFLGYNETSGYIFTGQSESLGVTSEGCGAELKQQLETWLNEQISEREQANDSKAESRLPREVQPSKMDGLK